MLMLCGAFPTLAEDEVAAAEALPDLELLEFLGSFGAGEDDEEWLELLEIAEKRAEQERRRQDQEGKPDDE